MPRKREFDPFGEHSRLRFAYRRQLLGANLHFRSNCRALLRLVEHAYAHLPQHRLGAQAPELRITLLLNKEPARTARGAMPGPFQLLHGSGLLAAASGGADCVFLAPQANAALIVVSERTLRCAELTRYELIEFAVFTLASRSQSLVPLHAACVALQGRGLLLMGDTGAGKSTLSLQCLLNGLDFLSEDSVFVDAHTLRATGIANFLHVRADSLRWIANTRVAAAIRGSPVIQRRSGQRKFEWDLRHTRFPLAAAPVTLTGVVFLSAQRAAPGSELLRPVAKKDLRARLVSLQPYASSSPEWQSFVKNVLQLRIVELRRGRHPAQAAAALHALLQR
jgi:hypothetical protein